MIYRTDEMGEISICVDNKGEITEMCKELLRQSKPIPYKMDDLLGNKLLTFFNRIIDEEF